MRSSKAAGASAEDARNFTDYRGSRVWAGAVSSAFEPLQSQFLEIRSLAGGLDGDTRQAAAQAFDAFIAAADRVNLLASPNASMIDSQVDELRGATLQLFVEAAVALGRIVPEGGTARPLPPGFAEKIAEYGKF